MPKYPRIRNNQATSEELKVGSTSTASTSSTSIAAELRRQRYEERQARLHFLRQETNSAQQRELNRAMAEQCQSIQQYVVLVEERTTGGNDSSRLRLYHQMVEQAEQLISNLQRMRRLERDMYDESRLFSQQQLEKVGQQRREFLISLEGVSQGIRIRSLKRQALLLLDERGRNLQDQIQQLEQSYQEEGKNLESLQARVRQMIEHFRERERYDAVRSAFLKPALSLSDDSKDYQTSTGRILKSICAAVRTGPSHDESSIGMSAHFGDNDTTPIDHSICVICRYEYKEEDVIVRNAIRESHTRCNHLFHKTCVTSWIESSQKAECPCCRQPYVVKT